MSPDQELVVALETAVAKAHEAEGRPFSGTRLGEALGEEYEKRGLQRGPGAYKPVMEEAVRQGRLRKIWKGGTVTMALLPQGAEVPAGWGEQPRRGSSEVVTTVALRRPPYLPRPLSDALRGRGRAAWADLSKPPSVTIFHEAREGLVAVEALPTDTVVQAWRSFATENGFSSEVADSVTDALREDPWTHVRVPDNPKAGPRFHRVRLSALSNHVYSWFSKHGLDAHQFEVPRMNETDHRSSASSALQQDTRLAALRVKLKAIIDRMSAEQLFQLRIPAEFLDV